MGTMNGYDITNDEQLRIITARLDEMAQERKQVASRLDIERAERAEEQSEWGVWRRDVSARVDRNSALIAERLAHPLMDPKTVEAIRSGQLEMAEHLARQDSALERQALAVAALTGEVNRRLAPLERISESLDRATTMLRRLTRLLRWMTGLLAGGALYEAGKLLAERLVR